MKPRQVREYRDEDPLTHGLWRGRLLYARLDEVGIPVTGKQVLDVGCGYGGLSLAAAERGATVTAVDADPANIAVVNRRAEASGAPIHSLVASATALPLASGHADVAMMIGVLEWVGYSHPHIPVRAQQVQALQEIRRALAPGGILVLATKNRLYPRYHWSDAQLHKPLLNILPRLLADRVARRRYATPYRAYIYSLQGWKRLFADGGFEIERRFVPLYTYQYPLVFAPLWQQIAARGAAVDRLDDLPSDVVAAALEQRTPARLTYYDVLGRLRLLGLGGGTFVFVCRAR